MRRYLCFILLCVMAVFITGCSLNSDYTTENNVIDNSQHNPEGKTGDISSDNNESKEALSGNSGSTNQSSSINQSNESLTNSKSNSLQDDKSIVYMTKDISPEGLVRIYEKLDRKATGKVGVKIHMGEPGGHNYLKPDLVKDLVLAVNGTFVDCNTAYGGNRATTAFHMKTAKAHGFTEYTSVDILDADDSIALTVENGKRLKENLVGSRFKDYDFFIVLSHFKGHAMAGFGGAIKNMSIGFASKNGKNIIHNGGLGDTAAWIFETGGQDQFLEAMAEAAKSIVDEVGDNILYINVMNNLSIDCDCYYNPAKPEIDDIGILASLDPVALDKACVDLIYKADEKDSALLRSRIETKNGTHVLEYAEEIGLGNRNYELVSIDD